MLYLVTSEELVFWGAVMTFHNIAILFIPLGFLMAPWIIPPMVVPGLLNVNGSAKLFASPSKYTVPVPLTIVLLVVELVLLPNELSLLIFTIPELIIVWSV